MELYYKKALNDHASSLSMYQIPLLWRPKILASFTTHSSTLSMCWDNPLEG